MFPLSAMDKQELPVDVENKQQISEACSYSNEENEAYIELLDNKIECLQKLTTDSCPDCTKLEKIIKGSLIMKKDKTGSANARYRILANKLDDQWTDWVVADLNQGMNIQRDKIGNEQIVVQPYRIKQYAGQIIASLNQEKLTIKK